MRAVRAVPDAPQEVGRREHPAGNFGGINDQGRLRQWCATVADHYLAGSQAVAEGTNYHRKVIKKSKRLPLGFSRTGWDLKLKLAARKWEAAERLCALSAIRYAGVAQSAANAAVAKGRPDPRDYHPEG